MNKIKCPSRFAEHMEGWSSPDVQTALRAWLEQGGSLEGTEANAAAFGDFLQDRHDKRLPPYDRPAGGPGPNAVTVAEALAVLVQAKRAVGGDALLVLSLTGSGIPDANVSGLAVVSDGEGRYVRVECRHPDLGERGRLEELVVLAESHNVGAKELAARAGIDSDRLNNGSIREVIGLLLDEGEDTGWIAGLIADEFDP